MSGFLRICRNVIWARLAPTAKGKGKDHWKPAKQSQPESHLFAPVQRYEHIPAIIRCWRAPDRVPSVSSFFEIRRGGMQRDFRRMVNPGGRTGRIWRRKVESGGRIFIWYVRFAGVSVAHGPQVYVSMRPCGWTLTCITSAGRPVPLEPRQFGKWSESGRSPARGQGFESAARSIEDIRQSSDELAPAGCLPPGVPAPNGAGNCTLYETVAAHGFWAAGQDVLAANPNRLLESLSPTIQRSRERRSRT